MRIKNLKFKITVSIFLLSAICYLLSAVSYAQPPLPYDLIGIPTAYPIQKGNYSLDFRIYGGGGAIVKVRLGLLDALFLGLSLSVDSLIGSNPSSIPTGNPGVIAKFRVFDEITSKSWPTISLGFDSSNYWGIKGKGFYGVVSKEFPIGKMFTHIHGGFNWSVGNNMGMGFFMGCDLFFAPEFSAIGEFELVNNDATPPQLYGSYNFGLQYAPISTLKVGFFLRNLVGSGGVTGTREIHIGYTNKIF